MGYLYYYRRSGIIPTIYNGGINTKKDLFESVLYEENNINRYLWIETLEGKILTVGDNYIDHWKIDEIEDFNDKKIKITLRQGRKTQFFLVERECLAAMHKLD